MVPVISEQNTLSIAAAVIGLAPMFPVMGDRWLPLSVMPDADRTAKLFVDIDKRSTGAGPRPAPPAPAPAPGALGMPAGASSFPPPLPHPAPKAASSTAMDHVSGLTNLFIVFYLMTGSREVSVCSCLIATADPAYGHRISGAGRREGSLLFACGTLRALARLARKKISTLCALARLAGVGQSEERQGAARNEANDGPQPGA